MPIVTRSKQKKETTEEEGGSNESDKQGQKISKKKKNRPCVIHKIDNSKTKKKQDDDDSLSSSDDEDDDDIDDEEFDLPDHIQRNKKLMNTAQKIIQYIGKNTVSLEDILTSQMRMKHKADMFELFGTHNSVSIS